MQSELQTDAALQLEWKPYHDLETSHHWLEGLLTLKCLIQAVTKFIYLNLLLLGLRGKARSQELETRESVHLGKESPEEGSAGA